MKYIVKQLFFTAALLTQTAHSMPPAATHTTAVAGTAINPLPANQSKVNQKTETDKLDAQMKEMVEGHAQWKIDHEKEMADIKARHAEFEAFSSKILADLKAENAAREAVKSKPIKCHFTATIITAGNQTKESYILKDETNNRSVSKVFTYLSDINSQMVPDISIRFHPPALPLDEALYLLTAFDQARNFYQRGFCAQSGIEYPKFSGSCTCTFPPQIKPNEPGQ